ncbi:ABC transporter permease [Tepidiforma sp.]|uniref:ABC transporter permease n=1 Tax=Tepidiforma sp. TaxID=2682230 RepID=UPI002ADD385B|nr:ABC transporter permease [Tepidiforma sp.]
MQRIIVRRLVLSIPTLLIVSFLIFGILRLDPDAAVAARLGEGYTPEAAEQLKEELGLNNPIATEYLKWLGNLLRGDWGTSMYSREPVLEEVLPKVGVTLELALVAVIFAVLIGIPIGVISAMRQDSWLDYLLRSFSVLGLSVPGFVVATFVLTFLALQFQWIPPRDYKAPWEDPLHNIQQFGLAGLILSLSTAAAVMRYSRTMMLDVLRQDYIRTAWAKGLRERVVITRHALKNVLLPVVTVIGLTMATLVGGTVIFESLFTLDGVGRLLIRGVYERDYPLVQGVTLLFAIAVVVINLVVDVSYSLLDPRARG